MIERPSAKLLFGSDLLPQLLEVLFAEPRRQFGWRDLERELGGPSPESLSRALNRGVELGVIERRAKGAGYGVYSAATSSPLSRDLRRILDKLDTRPRRGAASELSIRRLGELLAAGGPDGQGISAQESAWIHQFIDEFRSSRRRSRRQLLAEEPPPTGKAVLDAYLGALAEHLAGEAVLPVPAWTEAPGRFLRQWWIESDVPSARPTALATSPAAFRRRGVFISERSLTRA